MPNYIHGYLDKEKNRLLKQNQFLSSYIYEKIDLSGIDTLIEIGCGVGAQMIKILSDYPDIHVTGVDISLEQLHQARANLTAAGISTDRYTLVENTDERIPLKDNDFDAVIGIWVLEHVSNPMSLLQEIHRVLKPEGRFLSTEVFNDSFKVYPHKDHIYEYWEQLQYLQSANGGDGNRGVYVAGLLQDTGFVDINTGFYPMLKDKTNPADRLSMWKYWFDLMESVRKSLIDNEYIDQSLWENVVLEFTELMGDEDSVFFYNFVQTEARKG